MNALAAIFAVAAAVLAGVAGPSRAQEPTAAGLWEQQHPESRQPLVWFLVVDRDGVFEGHIAKVFPPSEHLVTDCALCTDDRKDAPALGLSFLRGMKRAGLRYDGGTVLDPRSGKIFNALMHLSRDDRTLAFTTVLPGISNCPGYWHRLPDSAYRQLDPAIVSIVESARGRADK